MKLGADIHDPKRREREGRLGGGRGRERGGKGDLRGREREGRLGGKGEGRGEREEEGGADR